MHDMLWGSIKHPSVLGVDASLTSTGYSLYDGYKYVTGRVLSEDLRGAERLAFIEQAIAKQLARLGEVNGGVDLLVLEGYSMGGRSGRGRLFDIGELGGTIKLLAFRMRIAVLLVPPSNLKQFATGKGGSDKKEVIQAVLSEWGENIPQDDEADAFVLVKMGEAFLSSRHPRKTTRAKALASCSIQK